MIPDNAEHEYLSGVSQMPWSQAEKSSGLQ
jgi:hypothetical protein